MPKWRIEMPDMAEYALFILHYRHYTALSAIFFDT